MKKLTLFATLCALLLGACTTNELDNITPEENTSISLPDLTAGFTDEEATKTYVENGKYLRWHEDDRITAFFGNTLNRQYKFKGKTGANSGTFSLVPSGELGTGNDLEAIYAVYPYDESAEISDEGVISLSLPAVQNFAEESFGRGANTMIAVTAGLEDTFLGFKNACGYLKLKLYNEEGEALRSVEVKGNNGEKIAGSATATMEFGGVPTLTMGADATTSVTLDCGEEGIELGTTAETATELWIVLPATTFEGGITITATDIEGGTFEKSTTKPVAITRNDIQPMAALEAEFVVPTPETWKIYYTATAKIEKQSWSNTTFGANIVSNEWDSATGKGVITFDGAVTEIGYVAFNDCKGLISITIPESVTVIGDWAFCDCGSLTSVTIPESVTEIGDSAFAGCSSLEKIEGKFASEDGRCLIVNGVLNSFAIGCGVAEYTIPDSVTEIGENAFNDCKGLISITIPNSVTEIGRYSFFSCTSLTSVTIPDSVTEIGEFAFGSCSSLTSITIPDSVTEIGCYAFYQCKSLTSVYCEAVNPPVANQEGSSSWNAFNSNADGRKIYVPTESVEAYKAAAGWSEYADSIEPYVAKPANNEIWYTATAKVEPYDKTVFGANYVSNEWDSATGKGVITFDGVVTKIGEYGFQARAALTSVAIPSGVTVIGDRVFWNCSKLESVTIPEGVTSIGNEVFAYCSSMKSITIPQSVTSIGKILFLGWCDSLEKFEGKFASEDGRCLIVDGVINSFAHAGLTEYAIPDGVTAIGERAFTYCTKLTSITIPDSVTEIGWNAFYNCSKLESIDIPDSVTLIHQGAFEMCSLKNGVTLPKELKVIYSNTFKYCDFTSITIPESVTRIDSQAFEECWYLTDVTIPDSVTSIGDKAFYNCSRLENVTIGSGVTSIGNNAFDGCSRLASVYCKPTEVPTAGKNIFYKGSYYNLCVIYVPAESKNLYKEATNWSSFVPNIVGYDYDNGVVIEPTVSYTITLNDDWQKSDILNPNPVLFDGVYESFSNHGTSGNAFMYIDIEGYTNFKLYICCSAHSSYYVQVSQLDAGLYGWYWPDLDDATKSKAYQMGGESSGTSLSNYKLVEFDNIDGGKHRITIMYSKAGSQLGGNDRAYVLIPKEQ